MGSAAHIIRFKSVEELFDDKHVTTANVLSVEDLEPFESTAGFQSLKTSKDNKNTFRNLLLIPLFILNAMLSISSRDAPNLACAFPLQHKTLSTSSRIAPTYLLRNISGKLFLS